MKPNGSLSDPQEPVTEACSEHVKSSPLPQTLFLISSRNFVHTVYTWHPEMVSSLQLCDQNLKCISYLSYLNNGFKCI
jgi:hypothetical protein